MENKPGIFTTAARTAFVVVAVLTVIEFLTTAGLFTGVLMMILSLAAGLLNLCVAAKGRRWNEAALYVIAAVALSMGYWKLM